MASAMQPPDQQPATRQRWVPMSEAVELLGRPESSIRRLIAQERLIGEQVLRDPDNPRDTRLVWRILITDSPDDAPAPAESIESEHQPAIRHDPPDLSGLLLSKLDERDATIAEMAERERAQADRIATLAAEKAKAESDAAHVAELAEIERERRVEADKRAATFEQLAAERGRELERERQETARLRERRWWRWW